MGSKVRRILFEGHLLFSLPDVAAYLEMGDFHRKMEKVGLMPLNLPLPRELADGALERCGNHEWVGWDDLYKMDQRFKWGGSEIGRKLHMIRMWARNKDGDAYRLTINGEMVLVEQRPKALKDIHEFVEKIVEVEDKEVQGKKIMAKAKHEQDKAAVQKFREQAITKSMKEDSKRVDEHLNQAKIDLGGLIVDLDYMPTVTMFDHPVRVVAMVMIEGVEMPLLLQQDFCAAVGISASSSVISAIPQTDCGLVMTTGGERDPACITRSMKWISLRAGLDLLRKSNKGKARDLSQQLNTVDWRVIMTGKYEAKGANIVPVQQGQQLVPADINLDLMAIVENVQVESIKERREMREQMEKLLLAEQRNTQTVVQELSGVIRHITDKFDRMLQVDTTRPQPVKMEVTAPQTSHKEISGEPIPADKPAPIATKTKSARKTKPPFVPHIPKKDPDPTQPKIIGQDERTKRLVRERVGEGYLTSKIFLSLRGKNVKDNMLKLSQRARGEAERQGRTGELYGVPSPKPTRGKNPNTSNEVAYPVDILEKVFSDMKI